MQVININLKDKIYIKLEAAVKLSQVNGSLIMLNHGISSVKTVFEDCIAFLIGKVVG